MLSETLEIGRPLEAVQLRVKGSMQGSFLRLNFPASLNNFVWYGVTADGFKVCSDDLAQALETHFKGLHQ